MRATRTLSVRLASLGGAVALAFVGIVGTTGLVASGGPAAADTSPFTSTCLLAAPFGSTPFPGTIVTGKISPSPAPAGGGFSVTNLAIELTLPSSITSLIPGATIAGTFTSTLTATGATPSSQAVTYTIPTTTITNPAPPIVATAPDASFTADASGAPSVSISTGTAGSFSAVLNGTPVTPPSACTNPAETIDTATIALPAGQLSAVLPNADAPAGGATVVIHGRFLSNPTSVTFGGVPATSFKSLTQNSIQAVVPPGAAGTVEVEVTTPAGASTTVPFTYTNGPIVTGVSPSTGPPAGGTTVNITGTGFQNNGDATVVDFGSTPAASFTVNSDTSITAVSPPGTAVADVTVTAPAIGPAVREGHITGVPTVSIVSQQDNFNYREGYWLTGGDGGVFSYGNAPFEGSAGGLTLNAPIVGMASTPDAGGYWLVASDGGVFSYGDAQFWGSAGNLVLNSPIVGMAPTPDGFGYWLVAADGGVFSYGDAFFYGSAGGLTLNAPIVGMAATPDGGGYWLVAADGGVFSYGDAVFHGSMAGTPLVTPIVGVSATPDGGGYWMTTGDGGVFNMGDAGYFGSTSGTVISAPVVGLTGSPDGNGYWLAAADGGVFAYPDATFYGSAGGTMLNAPVVGMASS